MARKRKDRAAIEKGLPGLKERIEHHGHELGEWEPRGDDMFYAACVKCTAHLIAGPIHAIDASLNEPCLGEPPELTEEAQQALSRVYTRLLQLAAKRETRLAVGKEAEASTDPAPESEPDSFAPTPHKALDAVHALLQSTTTETPLFSPTLLYNEGWLLRLILDWFSKHEVDAHPLHFIKGAAWYSEALLPSAFLAKHRGDSLAESWTHADGVIGHFEIGTRAKGDLTLLANADQFVVLEAKLFSRLSVGVRNALYFDQAARNVACMAEVLRRAGRDPSDVAQLGFYVLAPHSQTKAGMFSENLSKASMLEKVHRRVQAYGGARDEWFSDWFRPTWERIDVAPMSWEAAIAAIEGIDPPGGESIRLFYDYCLQFNSYA